MGLLLFALLLLFFSLLLIFVMSLVAMISAWPGARWLAYLAVGRLPPRLFFSFPVFLILRYLVVVTYHKSDPRSFLAVVAAGFAGSFWWSMYWWGCCYGQSLIICGLGLFMWLSSFCMHAAEIVFWGASSSLLLCFLHRYSFLGCL